MPWTSPRPGTGSGECRSSPLVEHRKQACNAGRIAADGTPEHGADLRQAHAMSLPAAILDSLTDSGQRHDRPSPDVRHLDALARRATNHRDDRSGRAEEDRRGRIQSARAPPAAPVATPSPAPFPQLAAVYGREIEFGYAAGDTGGATNRSTVSRRLRTSARAVLVKVSPRTRGVPLQRKALVAAAAVLVGKGWPSCAATHARRAPTARPSASSRHCCGNRRMPTHIRIQTPEPLNCRSGFSTTISIALIRLQQANRLRHDSASVGTTW